MSNSNDIKHINSVVFAYKNGLISEDILKEVLVKKFSEDSYVAVSKVPSQEEMLQKIATEQKLKKIESQIEELEIEAEFLKNNGNSCTYADTKSDPPKELIIKEYKKWHQKAAEMANELTKQEEANKMANPMLDQLNAVTMKVISKDLDTIYNKTPFLSYLQHNNMAIGPIEESLITKVEPKPKKQTKLELAKSELKGMGFDDYKVYESKLSHEHSLEIRVETFSPTYGKITKIEKVYSNDPSTSVEMATKDAIIWIWQEARKRLIEGKIISSNKPSLKNPSGYMIGVDIGKS